MRRMPQARSKPIREEVEFLDPSRVHLALVLAVRFNLDEASKWGREVAAGCGLRAAGCGLRAAGCGLRAAGCAP